MHRVLQIKHDELSRIKFPSPGTVACIGLLKGLMGDLSKLMQETRPRAYGEKVCQDHELFQAHQRARKEAKDERAERS